MSIVSGDLSGALIINALLIVVLVSGEAWARLGNPKPEHSRKFVHLGSGMACLLFPFVIESPWVVGAMAGLMGVFFVLAARYHLLKSLHRVERRSRGSEYYPIAIFLVFLLARDIPWIYVSAVLALGVADAFAALVGIKYGRIRYGVQDERKSLEGSLAFFAIAFVAVLAPAELLSDLSHLSILYISFTGAVILTGFEAISLEGADNLLVPVAAAFILEKLTHETEFTLLVQNLVMVGCFTGLALLNWAAGALVARSVRRSVETAPFNVGGLIALTLFSYAAWAFGSIEWALPMLVGYGLGGCVWAVGIRRTEGLTDFIRVRTTYRALLLPFGLLIVANVFEIYDLLFAPFLAACAVVVTFSVEAFLRNAKFSILTPRPGRTGLLSGAVVGAAMSLTAYAVQPEVSVIAPLAIILLTALSALAHSRLVKDVDWVRDDFWPAPNFYLTAAIAGILIAAQLWGGLPRWNPGSQDEPWRRPRDISLLSLDDLDGPRPTVHTHDLAVLKGLK